MAEGLEWDWVSGPTPRSRAPRIYKRSHSATASIDNDFQILEFLILTTLLRREMYSVEVGEELLRLETVVELPKQGVIYTRLKDLVRSEFLSSRQQAGSPRIYFSMTQKGRDRLDAMCALTQSLSALGQATANARSHAVSPRS